MANKQLENRAISLFCENMAMLLGAGISAEEAAGLPGRGQRRRAAAGRRSHTETPACAGGHAGRSRGSRRLLPAVCVQNARGGRAQRPHRAGAEQPGRVLRCAGPPAGAAQKRGALPARAAFADGGHPGRAACAGHAGVHRRLRQPFRLADGFVLPLHCGGVCVRRRGAGRPRRCWRRGSSPACCLGVPRPGAKRLPAGPCACRSRPPWPNRTLCAISCACCSCTLPAAWTRTPP